MTLSPATLERIFMDADLESRKAKARLDQIPDEPVAHVRMKEYLRLMKMGTAFAVRDNDDDGPPVPLMTFDIAPFLELPVVTENELTQAWVDLYGNYIEAGGFMEPATIHLTCIPIYQASNEHHRAVNLQLIADKNWFVQRIAESSEIHKEVQRLNRVIMTCDVLMHEIKEMTDAGKNGADSPEQERETAG